MRKLAAAFGVDQEGESAELGFAIGERVRGIASHLKIPTTLRELGVGADDLPALAEECLSIYPRPNSPLVFDRKSMTEFYRRMWEGKLAA